MSAIWNGYLDLIFEAMSLIYNYVISDWGVSIIVLTIFFRLLVWPLMVKQTRSMRGMQKLQPLMKEVQEKYKDDKEKQSQEMMKLYKENNINPLGGCLPMLLQMPLMIGFFAVIMIPPVNQEGIIQSTFYGLGRLAHELGYREGVAYADLTITKANFLGVLPDITLTPSDAFNVLGTVPSIPYIVLLILSSVAILIPTLLNQKNMKGPQANQQRIIGYAMAVFMGIMGWGWFSGGVLLYLTTSSLFAAGQQWFVMQQMDKEDAAEEAAAEEAKAKKKKEKKMAKEDANKGNNKKKKK